MTETAASVPPDGEVEVLEAAPRVPTRRLLLGAAAVAVALALVLGTLTVVDAVRGGTRSPEVLARRLLSAVQARSPAQAYGLVEPRERRAARRLVGALAGDVHRLGLDDLLGSGPGDDLTLDGVELTLTGVQARTQRLSDDVAVLTFGTGQVRVQADPAAMSGLLHSYLVVRGRDHVTDRTVALRDLGDEGVRVLAVRERGRWYVSLLLTLVDGELGGDPAGPLGVETLPPRAGPGASAPEGAAQDLVDAGAAAWSADDWTLLAPALDRTGALVAALYGHALASTDGSPHAGWRSAGSTWRSTATGPDLAAVRVEALALHSSRRTVRLTPGCLLAGRTTVCLRGSAYRYPGSASTSLFELLGRNRAFGLTAVRDDGRWRVGLADSLVDGIVVWAGSLTREQVLALAGLVRLDTPGGRLTPGRAEAVTFTSAGYAVRTLHVTRPGLYRFAPRPSDDDRSAIYTSAGTPALQKFSPDDDSYDLEAGDYTVTVWADDAFAATLSGASPGPYRQRVEIRPVPGG